MTLVLCDQEIAPRDCENGVLGALMDVYLSKYGPQGFGKRQVGVQKSSLDGLLKSPCNEKSSRERGASLE
jgi:hypothetical protein